MILVSIDYHGSESNTCGGTALQRGSKKGAGWGWGVTSLESKVFHDRRVNQQEQLAEIQMNK